MQVIYDNWYKMPFGILAAPKNAKFPSKIVTIPYKLNPKLRL